jgi:hypothetical protein
LSIENIEKVLTQADNVDIREGKEAFPNYHSLLRKIAAHYHLGFAQTVAAFVSLSPNNDYMGNLRSLVSLCKGINDGTPVETIGTSAYRHCLMRAHLYLTGEKDFLLETKGLKITNFYCNILLPKDRRFVTIDGHMHNIWRGEPRPLKGSSCTPARYAEIVSDINKVARSHKLIPNQVQAITWFTWKRINKILYDSQISLFATGEDYWGLKLDPKDLRPYKQYGTGIRR